MLRNNKWYCRTKEKGEIILEGKLNIFFSFPLPLSIPFLQIALGVDLGCISPGQVIPQINPREHKFPKVKIEEHTD